jgi:formylglycine-generating enzyme
MWKSHPRRVGAIVLALGLTLAGFVTAGEKKFVNSMGMRFVLISAGEFIMGGEESPESVANNSAYNNQPGHGEMFQKEHPQHKVTISKAFYLQETEVTVDQFRRFTTVTGYRTDAEREGWGPVLDDDQVKWVKKSGANWKSPGFLQAGKEPVTFISWNDAVAFIAWLNRQKGDRYRLPTEAEWEYACRAGTDTPFYWGNRPSGRQANFADSAFAKAHPKFQYVNRIVTDGYVYTAPVGSFPPNAFGLYDMSGNVFEWCQDWFGDYSAGHAIDPQGPSGGKSRVLRGGSWFNVAWDMRSARRLGNTPNYRCYSTGFRVARTD